MAQSPITEKQKGFLNRLSSKIKELALGERIEEFQGIGVLAHSYASAHADKTYTAADLPTPNIVMITLTLADSGANLILPASPKKVYLIVNTSGQAITAKVTGKTGIAVANAKKALLTSDGTDIIRLTADA